MTDHHIDNKDNIEINENELTFRDKMRKKAKEKRKKDQMSVTVFGVVLYSIALIGIVVLSYIGFKSAIIHMKEKQQIALKEEEKANKELEEANKVLEEEKKAKEKEGLKEEANKTVEENDSEYKDTVFSVIENVENPGEALVNTYEFSRKALMDDGSKLLDYEVFTNPETKKIEKITTRENCGDMYEITDYYYDEGNVNYIAQYRQDIDMPIDLSSAKIESRFYFSPNGKLVKYIYCESDKATEYSKKDFDIYGEGTKEQYDYMEKMMLESSKTAFTNASELKEEVVISGYVLDEIDCPTPENAKVELLDTNGKVVDELEANDDGYYEFIVQPNDNRSYNIHFSCREDMVETTVYGVKACKGAKTVDVDTVYLAYSSHDTVYPVPIFVKDADNPSLAVAGATIKFRYGINNRDGENSITGVLGEAGEIMASLRSGNYTVEITKDGYETCYYSFAVKENKTAIVAYAVKEVKEGTIKCVLSYDTTPLDLDIKAFDTYGRTAYKSVNDSVGVTMAETIEIKEPDNGVYSFYVSDYTAIASGDMMSYNLSNSIAKVSVYDSEGLEAVFSVPAGHAGIVWRPFEIRNHRIVTINDYYSYVTEDSIFRKK